jgi:hypothetical protein
VTAGAPAAKGPGARALVLALLVVAGLLVVLPAIIARTRRLRDMRSGLAEVVDECRARYAENRSAADTAATDAWRPPLHGVQRPGDPACGDYRRRNMLKTVAR